MALLVLLVGCSLSLSLENLTSLTPESEREKINLQIDAFSVSESSSPVVVVLLSKPSNKDVQVKWQITSATGAVPSDDFTSTNGFITISKGQATASISLPIANDDLYEGDEQFTLSLVESEAAGLINPRSVAFTLIDDEAFPTVHFAASTQSLLETDGASTAQLTVSPKSSFPISVSYSVGGTATNPADHNLAPGTLLIVPGQSSATIPFTLVNDSVEEVVKTLVITLDSATGATTSTPLQQTITLADDDAFLILGATGGTDSIVDPWVRDTTVTVHWNTAPGATSYDVSILNAAGDTPVCGTQSTTQTSYTFTGCTLSDGVAYSVAVTAHYPDLSTRDATNNLADFTVDITPPSGFAITGATGSADITLDQWLSFGQIVTANWQAAGGATKYLVTIYDSSGLGVICPAQETTSLTYTFTGCTLTEGSTYRIDVTASDAAGNQTAATGGSFAFTVNSSTPAAFTISGVSGGGDSDFDSWLRSTEVTANWNDTSNEASYDVTIYEADGSTVACPKVNKVAGLTSHTFTGCTLTSGQVYKLSVVALGISGNTTAASNSLYSFTVDTSPPGAFTVAGVDGGATDSTIDAWLAAVNPKIHWSASSALNVYLVSVFEADGTTVKCAEQSVASGTQVYNFSSCALTNGQSYFAKVVARDLAGNTTEATNSPFSFSVDTASPSAFSITGVTGGSDSTADAWLTSAASPTLTWQGATGASGYQVTVLESDGVTTKCAPESSAATTFAFIGCSLTEGASYKAKVIASDDAGNTTQASLFSFTVDSIGPGAFTITGATGGADLLADEWLAHGLTVTAHWLDSADEASYVVSVLKADDSEMCAPVTLPADTLTYAFAACPLVDNTSYKIKVIAKDATGNSTAASNSPFVFTVDTTGPAAFPITGITGGTDNTADGWLSSGSFATVRWTDTTDESGYSVTVYEADGTTVKCATAALAANSTSHTFGTCSLTEGESYKAVVVAQDALGHQQPATGSPISFTVQTGPGAFSITGVTGGTNDTTADAIMGDGAVPIVNWSTSSAAVNYDVTIKNTDTSVKCATVTKAAPALSHTFTGCTLEQGRGYVISVIARDGAGNELAASNQSFSFTVKSGLYLSGTGGSMLYGVPITTCGGTNGDECTSAAPYSVTTALNVAFLTLQNAAYLTAPAWTTGAPGAGNGSLIVTVSNDTEICATCAITVSLKGYTPGNGPGKGTDSSGSGGGAYGGKGGSGANSPTSISGGSAYGDLRDPNSIGSGPGVYSNYCLTTAKGGGLLRLTVGGTLSLNGTISADGGSCAHYMVGAGSGGGIKITAGTITGSGGKLQANGGNTSAFSGYYGGGGSGGRIAVLYANDTYTGGVNSLTLQAFGGFATGAPLSQAPAGTIFLRNTSTETNGRLIIDNNGRFSYPTTPLAGSDTFDSLIIRNQGNLEIPAAASLLATSFDSATGVLTNNGTFSNVVSSLNFHLINSGTLNIPGGNLTVASTGTYEHYGTGSLSLSSLTVDAGGTLTHYPNSTTQAHSLNLSVSGDMTIAAGAMINLDERGFDQGYGPGKGTDGSGSGGGAYGGKGGTGSSGYASYNGGGAYGDLRDPNSIGSGPGVYSGYCTTSTKGGGLLRLSVGGTLSLNGTISANGGSCTSFYVGGGSGGGIKISAGTITGSGGKLQANGGNTSTFSGYYGGGGSGGRIAVLYANDTYTGGVNTLTLQAFGGFATGVPLSQAPAGTIFLRNTSTETNGRLIIDNNGDANNRFIYLTTPLAGSDTFDSLIIRNQGNLEILAATTLSATSFNGATGVLTNNGIFSNDVSSLNFHLINAGTINIPGGNFTITNGGKYELYGTGTFSLTSLTIDTGGTLTHYPNSTTQAHSLNLSVSGDMTLATGAMINLDARGFKPGNGPGKGTDGSGGSGGGAYGGKGGTGVGGLSGGNAYGDLRDPNSIGSGPGLYASDCLTTAKGGGLLRLTVGGTLSLNGTISANGGSCTSYYVGAGSGGGIKITAGTVTGSGGKLQANGGNSYFYSGYHGGGGSGGRIAVLYANDTYTGGVDTLTLQAFGGFATGAPLSQAPAGTIFLRNTSTETNGRLIIDNNGRFSYLTTPLLSSDTFDSLIIRNQGNLEIPAAVSLSATSFDGVTGILTNNGTFANVVSSLNFHLINSGSLNIPGGNLTVASTGKYEQYGTGTLSLTSLTVDAGGTLTHYPNSTTQAHSLNLSVSGDMNLATGAMINLDARGFKPGNGPGKGTDGSGGSGGGAYGGKGGTGVGGLSGGNAYGDLRDPNSIGSGPGVYSNYCLTTAIGGGLLRLTVGGTLSLNGTISANGGSCSDYNVGAASGGGIKITTGTITGSGGKLQANGGNSYFYSGYHGGGGSGGRIALLYANDTYTGGVDTLTLQAFGGFATGASLSQAAAGTIFLRNISTETNGRLIIDNNGDANNRFSYLTTPLAGSDTFDSLILRNQGNLEILATTTLLATSFNGATGVLTNNGTFPSDVSSLNFHLINAGTINIPGGNFTITSGGKYEHKLATGLSLSSLYLADGSTMTHFSNSSTAQYALQVSTTGNMTMEPNAIINVNGRGFSSGYGPGVGATRSSSSYGGGGGAYGGNGGNGYGSTAGGLSYGTPADPAHLGSAGSPGDCVAGSGGGLASFAVGGTLDFRGKIYANGGATNCSYSGGGGSGGGVKLSATVISGNGGVIESLGGNAAGTRSGGGGGGGRIAIIAGSDSYTGGISSISAIVTGGTSAQGTAGQAGSVYRSP